MVLQNNSKIQEISNRLKVGMVDFIEPGETSYTISDVDRCMKLISNHVEGIQQSNSKEEALEIVEKTVVSLNELNEECEYELIETEQREDLAAIIILASHLKGYNSLEEDITEDWREW